MIHTYIMKFFNSTMRDINNPEKLAQREAIIDYNNKEWQAWFEDFTKAIANTRQELAGKTDLNDREKFLKDMLRDGGIVNKLIQVITNEFTSINESISRKLEARKNGAKVVINGQDAISEIITYALTDPRIFRLLNELKSTTDRIEGSEDIETPTFWNKFKKVLLNIFQKIFGVIDTKVKADSLMERLNDTINRIYNKDFRDMDPNVTISSIRWSLEAPGREGDVVERGTSAETTVESPILTETETEVQTEESIDTTIEEDEDIDWDDDYVDIKGDLKLSMSLSDSSSIATNISKYLNDSVASLNKNTNFDETNKRIC